MKNYVKINNWSIIEEDFHPEENRIYESLMSIGNGRMGVRGNFEEDYSGDTLKGSYIAGVYYPDKTRVGWWKNGYPEYFAKVLNAPNFIGIRVKINGEILDIAKIKLCSFKRELNMKEGVLYREFVTEDSAERKTKVETKRFLSCSDVETGAIEYSITPLNYDAEIEITPYIDGNVFNEDSNYDEMFWEQEGCISGDEKSVLSMKTKKTSFIVSSSFKSAISIDNDFKEIKKEYIKKDKFIGTKYYVPSLKEGCRLTIYKYIGVTSNRYYKDDEVEEAALKAAERAYESGFDKIISAHIKKWNKKWGESDITIEGDTSAQQAIRFNVFQLNQTYTGDDPRLNIGPKGFTGEKYGGSTYWDTEAYCLPFYLSTADKSIARQLLMYRYKHLEKAKENARKLGLKGALYPMVTMNGEECHNEWEITFEEIHRNAAIAYAIFNYVRYTGDEEYIPKYGLEVVVETCRFWASRVNYNPYKDKYMIIGVTGPNEYENNVNNNWYTNTMASWNIQYAIDCIELVKSRYKDDYERLKKKLNLNDKEIEKWKDIVNKMYKPYIKEFDVFGQQDGYMDKEQLMAHDLPKEERPINQHWSWDRILRSCFIKQADVLQGIYFFDDKFDMETKKRNFDFYEPRTVHESSLSPCIHCILAAEIGYKNKAYEMYLRTARLDLNNYNNDTCDGLHITSMAGTWMSMVYGFGGMRVNNGMLSFKPFIPEKWKGYSFRLQFRDHHIKVEVNSERINVTESSGEDFTIILRDKKYLLGMDKPICIKY